MSLDTLSKLGDALGISLIRSIGVTPLIAR